MGLVLGNIGGSGGSGSITASQITDSTAAGRAVLTAADAAAQRTALGLGTIATQAASAVAVTGGTITGLTDFGVSMANNTAITGIGLGTITDTTSRPFAITQTWNNAGLTATALRVNVTDTASNASSILADFQVGGSSKVKIDKSGRITGTTGTVSGQWDMQIVTASGVIYANDGLHLGSQKGIHKQGGAFYFNMTDLAGTGHSNPAWLGAGASGSCNWLVFNNYTFNSTVWDALRVGYTSNIGYVRTEAGSTGTVRPLVIGAGPSTGTNIAGPNVTITAGNGTGTGGSGKLIFQTAPTGSSGTTANTMATALEIDKDRVVFVADTNAAPSGTPASGGYLYVESGALKFKGSSGTVTTIANA